MYEIVDVYFTPVACFLLMSVGDYVGRTSAGIIPKVCIYAICQNQVIFMRIRLRNSRSASVHGRVCYLFSDWDSFH